MIRLGTLQYRRGGRGLKAGQSGGCAGWEDLKQSRWQECPDASGFRRSIRSKNLEIHQSRQLALDHAAEDRRRSSFQGSDKKDGRHPLRMAAANCVPMYHVKDSRYLRIAI